MKRMIYLMGLGLARARRAGMSGTSVTAAARRTAMTAMFVMLAGMTAWAENVTVNYIDADGNQQSVSATVLTGSESELGEWGMTKWYVVNSTFSHEGQIQCDGNVNIILADGCKMTTSNSSYVINGGIGTLTIYGQTNGNGTLEVTSTGSSAIYHSGNVVICSGTVNATGGGSGGCAITANGNVTINGGTVNATTTAYGGTGIGGNSVTINGGTVTATANDSGGTGIDANIVTINGGTVSASSDMFGIYASTSVTISGGTVTATGNVRGIDTYRGSGTITLGWKNATDRIKASKYRGTVTIADGKYMKDGSGNVYYGTLTDAQKSAIANVELQPASEAEFIAAALPLTATDTYTISDAAGWTAFCLALQDNATYNRFSGKTVTLANDITVTRMAGSSGHEFMGTFDGNKKTLTVNYSGSSYVAPFSYVDGATIQNLVVEGTISSSGTRAAGVIGETGSPGATGKSYITNCVSSSTISGGNYTGGFSIGGNVEIEGCVFNGTIISSGDYGGGGFVGFSQSTLKIKNCLFAPKDGSSVKGTFYYNGTAGTLTNCFYTQPLGTAQGKAPRSVTAADENVDIIGIDFTGDGGTYEVSGISTSNNGGIEFGGQKYIGGGDVVGLTLGHADPQEGYMFSRYTVTGGGTLDDPTSNTPLLTMTDADQTIGAEYAPIPTHAATFAYGSGGEGWTIDDDADGATPYEGKAVTVGYSGPHKVKSVRVAPNRNTLSGLKALIDAADATALAELKAEYVGKYITATGDIKTGSEGAVAIICYVGTDAETNADYKHGLALALADANGGSKCEWVDWHSKNLPKQYSTQAEAKTDMAGIANTDELASGFAADAAYAAPLARAYNDGAHPTGTSEWFLPSVGQWDKMITAAGGYADLKTIAGLPQSRYWSSTEKDSDNAWCYRFSDGNWVGYGKTGVTSTTPYVRAALAF